jgi:surfeit locus 1 family protein
MMRRLIFPVLLGLVGAAVLVGLGVWQLQRLEWKTAKLAQIEAKIGTAPVALPATVSERADIYLPVVVEGRLVGPEALVLTGLGQAGAGYRVIAAFEVAESGRKIMVDLGFVAEADRAFPRPTTPMTVTGNLNWPAEKDSFTPEPDLIRGIWFARDVERMANVLGAEQVLVVAKAIDPAIPAISPLPVDTSTIANDHLNYAITWFSLAVVWLAMTVLLIWRIRRRDP